MATMYETIMDLPLFKGVSKDHVSMFLEKTNLHFENFKADDIIVKPGEMVTGLKYVIKGSVATIYINDIDGMRVSSVSSIGTVIGAGRLFGRHPRSRCTIKALSQTSIMEFSKEQYVNLLNSDPIYLLNFFNYLSLHCQRSVDIALDYPQTLLGRLGMIVNSLTEADSNSICVGLPVALFQQLTHEEGGRELSELVKRRLVTVEGCTVKIVDRMRLLDAASQAVGSD